MDNSLQSPTGTHISRRSSFNPFSNRPKLEGLRDRAGAALRSIMPKRKGRNSEINRPRTAPYTLRPGQSTSQNDTNLRPNTAMANLIPRAQDTIPEEEAPVAKSLNVDPDSNRGKVPGHDVEMTLIPTVVLSKMIELAESRDKLVLADVAAKCRTNELDTLETRMLTVSGNAYEMQSWLADTRDEKALSSQDPEDFRVQTDADIDKYQQRIDSIQQHIQETRLQREQMKSKIEKLELEHQNLERAVFEIMRESWPEPGQDPVEDVAAVVNTELSFDPESLVEFEEDYDAFSKAVYGEPDQRANYPDEEEGDYVPLVLHMRVCKQDYENAVQRLELISAEQRLPLEELTALELAQEAAVALKRQILADAVENCRRSGVHVADDGNEIVNKPGAPFWDLTLHGKEKIIGRMHEDHNVEFFEEAADMTQEEIEAHIARGQATTEIWLDGNNLIDDPNQVWPLTPRTPATPGFQGRMRDVEIGETSVDEAQDMQPDHVVREYQAALATWKATQEQQRLQSTALVAEHNRSDEDLMEDVHS